MLLSGGTRNDARRFAELIARTKKKYRTVILSHVPTDDGVCERVRSMDNVVASVNIKVSANGNGN